MHLVKGTVLLIIGGIIAMFLSAVTGLIVARLLGPEHYGIYTIGLALPNAFIHTFLFGLDSIIVREIAQSPKSSNSVFLNSLLPACLWSSFLIGIITVLSRLLGFSDNIILLVFCASIVFAFRAIVNLFRAFFRGFERMELDALVQILEGLGGAIFVGIIFVFSKSALSAILGLFVAESITFFVALILVRNLSGSIHSYDWKKSLSLIQAAIPLGVTFTILGLNLRLDILLLSRLDSETNVGLYAAAFGCVMLSSPISLFSASLLPRLSVAAISRGSEFATLWEKGLRYTLILGFAIGAVTGLYAPFLLHTLYGPEFLMGAAALRILGVTTSLLFINRYLWHVLIACEKQKVIALSGFLGLLSTLVLSLLLIPRLGIIGAAYATVGRECCQLVIMSYFLSKQVPRFNAIKTIGIPLIGILVMIASLLKVAELTSFHAVLYLPLALIMYFLVLRSANGIKAQEMKIMKTLFLSLIPFRR